MTDKDLIARLRSVHSAEDCDAAADRIEAMIADNQKNCEEILYWRERTAHLETALRWICRQPDYRLPSPQEIARAALEGGAV